MLLTDSEPVEAKIQIARLKWDPLYPSARSIHVMNRLPKLIRILLGLFLILFITGAILSFRSDPVGNHPYFQPDGFLVIAHRGGGGLGPESTLDTFQKAVNLGADVLEMDIQSTRDNDLVVIHDRDVARTTNGSGPVDNFSLAGLKELDAGYRWSPDGGATFPLRNQGIQIPTLAEVFEAFPRMRLNLEIKYPRANTIPALCRLIRDHRMSEKVMVACFDAGQLDQFRSACPEVATSAGSSEALLFYWLQWARLESVYSPKAQALQIPEYYGDIQVVTRRFLDAAHTRNLRVHAWTINDVTAMKRLYELGVDGIMTDYPDRLLEIVNPKKKKPD